MQEKEQFMKGPRIKRNNYILFDRKVVKKKKMDEYLYIDLGKFKLPCLVRP
jgi:hypothetical protein